MKQKINLRLIGIAVLAVLATMISVTFIFYGLFQKQVRNDLKINADILEATGFFQQEYEGDITSISDIDAELEAMFADVKDLRITWIDSDGTVLFDNDNRATALQNHADRPEVKEAFETGEGEITRRSDTMNNNTFYYAVRLDDGTVLRLSVDAGSMGSVFMTAFPVIILIVALIILLCAILAHFLTRKLLAPIRELGEKIEDTSHIPVYKELVPFVNTIRAQHENILSAARSRQDFTANVSHELKTPLTAISGYAELIENHMVDAEQETHFAAQIRKNADRLVTLINDIIRLSELDGHEQTNFEQIDLYEIAENCVELLKVSASQRSIRLNLRGDSCTIRGNKSMIRELIDNLVQNAIRYNNDGGVVNVFVVQDERPLLIVSDSGIGIPKDQQERVFERFYRVDKSRSKRTGGTGLGLAIVKHIVELHDAEIFLDSEVGRGTIIRVRF